MDSDEEEFSQAVSLLREGRKSKSFGIEERDVLSLQERKPTRVRFTKELDDFEEEVAEQFFQNHFSDQTGGNF